MTAPVTASAELEVDVPLVPVPADPGHLPVLPRGWWASMNGQENRFVVDCPGHEHRVGLVKHDGHLVYRPHQIATYAGGHVPCSRSLVRYCEGPPIAHRSILCVCGSAPAGATL